VHISYCEGREDHVNKGTRRNTKVHKVRCIRCVQVASHKNILEESLRNMRSELLVIHVVI
jgi:hypothetical protein